MSEKTINDIIKDYIYGYELRGDNGDYTPTEQERFLMMDCILGLIEESEFLSTLKVENDLLSRLSQILLFIEQNDDCTCKGIERCSKCRVDSFLNQLNEDMQIVEEIIRSNLRRKG